MMHTFNSFFLKCPWTSVYGFVSDAVNVVFGSYIKKMQLAQNAEGTRQADEHDACKFNAWRVCFSSAPMDTFCLT